MAVYYPSLSSNRDNLYPEPPHQTLGSFQKHDPSSGSFSEMLAGNNRNEMVFIPPTSDLPVLPNHSDGMNENASGNTVSSVEYNFHVQGLSLSLGTQILSAVPAPPFQYNKYSNDEREKNKELEPSGLGHSSYSQFGFEHPRNIGSGGLEQCGHMQSGIAASVYNNGCQYETPGFVSSLLHSKYLKPVQQLLDEVVSDWRDLKRSDKTKDQSFSCLRESKETDSCSKESNVGSSELSSSERHDLQYKKTKLLSMVDEVDRRYNQYYHQMQAVASSFEIIAGLGSAKPYIAVALHRISRHFRCLRDAIRDQIQVACRKLGEQDTSNEMGERIPRLRYLDQRLRQQKALHQQLGMVRPSWRPQRGLPENAVSILRSWLFEHFLHPYPKESEKLLLSKQTGLSKNQVANWFINARVRLWKPMIEEMYKEEFGDSQPYPNDSQENPPNEPTGNSSGDISQETPKFPSDGTNFVFSEQINDQKSDCCVNDPISQPNDYAMMNQGIDRQRNGLDYHEFNLDNSADYSYMGHNQTHDFVV